MKKHSGYLNINIIILIALVLMIGYWLVTSPRIDILKTVQELPKLTVQKITTPGSLQDSQVNKKPVIDQKAVSQLSTKSINNLNDLNNINRDLSSSQINNIETAINQIETEVE